MYKRRRSVLMCERTYETDMCVCEREWTCKRVREGVGLHVFVCESVFNRHCAAASVPEHACGRERAGGLARERKRERGGWAVRVCGRKEKEICTKIELCVFGTLNITIDRKIDRLAEGWEHISFMEAYIHACVFVQIKKSFQYRRVGAPGHTNTEMFNLSTGQPEPVPAAQQRVAYFFEQACGRKGVSHRIQEQTTCTICSPPTHI